LRGIVISFYRRPAPRTRLDYATNPIEILLTLKQTRKEKKTPEANCE